MGLFKETYLIFDALDECVERQKLLANIEEWKDANLHVLVSSRPMEDMAEAMNSFLDNQLKIRAYEAFVNDDIRVYVSSRLQTDRRLRQWGPDVHQEIEHVILEKADGMFLWALCQLNSLKACSSIRILRQALASSPSALNEYYSRILCDIDEGHFKYAFKILQWLTYSARPLELKELDEVIADDLEESPCYDPTRRLLKPKDTLTMCSNLICVEDRAVKDRDNKNDGNGNRTLYSQFLKISVPWCILTRKYAAKYWTQHAQAAERQDGFYPHLTILFLTTEDYLRNWICLYDPDYPQSDLDRDRSLKHICPRLYYASMAGLSKLVQILLENGDDPNARGGFHGKALQAASLEGHFEVVQLLLASKADVDAQEGYIGSALAAASFGGHIQVVQLLLDNGADVHAQGGYSNNALQAASKEGYERLVQLLLEHGADVNAESGTYRQALQATSEGGHEHLVQLLLEKGGDVNALGRHCGTALQVASLNDHPPVVQMLLNHGADANIANGLNNTALHLASSEGHERVVQMLLEHGADINAGSSNALQAASSNGHDRVVKMLLEHGADINTRFGRQALRWASRKGHDRVVQMLLEHGARFLNPENRTLDRDSTTDRPSQDSPVDTASKKNPAPMTEEELRHLDPSGRPSGQDASHITESAAQDSSAPDILFLNHHGRRIPLYFPALAIEKGIVKVGDLGARAEKEFQEHEWRDFDRIDMFYVGKALQDDKATCWEEGLKAKSEVKVLVFYK